MKVLMAIVGLLAASPAAAEVVSASANGFHLRHSVTLTTGSGAAFDAFAKIDRWWSPDHTYGGDASRLSLALKPGGCFCEALTGGGVEHLRVNYVDRPKRLVLTGALGPLLYQAVAGVMDVRFEADGAGTKVTLDFKAAGFATGGADTLAPAVDKVLGEQFTRYAAFARKP